MFTRIKHCTAIVAFSLLASTVTAESRHIFLDKELKNASFVGLVVIDGYDKEKFNILFHSIEYKDTIHTAEACCYSGEYKNSEAISYMESVFTEGVLPPKNDTVLIVIDSTKQISLFAKLIGNDFRFWSPVPTGSGSYFSYNKPAKKLPSQKEKKSTFLINGIYEDYYSCWEGCLLPKEYIKTYGRKE